MVASRRVDCSFYNPHIVSRSPAGGSKAGVVQNLGNSAARSAPCGRWWNASLAAIFTPWRIQKYVAELFGNSHHVVARCDDSTIVPFAICDELPASEFRTSDRQLATNWRGQESPRTRFRVCIEAPGGSICRRPGSPALIFIPGAAEARAPAAAVMLQVRRAAVLL